MDDDPVAELIRAYQELNSPLVSELFEDISALEFMRYVARNRPFVLRGGAAEWKATRTWSLATLKDLLRDQLVNVAVTPKGYAVGGSPLLARKRETEVYRS